MCNCQNKKALSRLGIHSFDLTLFCSQKIGDQERFALRSFTKRETRDIRSLQKERRRAIFRFALVLFAKRAI